MRRAVTRKDGVPGEAGSSLFFVFGALIVGLLLSGFTWPWDLHGPWPQSSERPVEVLEQPSLESAVASAGDLDSLGFRFAAFGDQRALADGEWQALLRHLAALDATDEGLLFMLDTGDIVQDGRHSDQYWMLRDILSAAPGLPYLVAVGNHEVRNNEDPTARENTARALAYLSSDIAADRMYYRKDIGPLTLLCLESNDLVYGDGGDASGLDSIAAGTRGRRQLEWLATTLATVPKERLLVVALHHPFMQSSMEHLEQARALWGLKVDGRSLPDLLADHDVDLVLVGHTHTYEHFRLRREDGAGFDLVNLSGRPRTSFLWIGDGARRARDIRGKERAWLTAQRFANVDRWEISQLEVMLEQEADQVAILSVRPDGTLGYDVRFLDDAAAEGAVTRYSGEVP